MYHDFLKCLMLYNNRELRMTASELMLMIHPFCLLVLTYKAHLEAFKISCVYLCLYC